MDLSNLHPNYVERILGTVREAIPDNIIFAESCNCATLAPELLRGEWEPVFVEGHHSAAVRAWAYHRVLGTLYWGVHWRGKHILNVPNRYGV